MFTSTDSNGSFLQFYAEIHNTSTAFCGNGNWVNHAFFLESTNDKSEL